MRLTSFSDYALRMLMYTASAGGRLITIEECPHLPRIEDASQQGRQYPDPQRLSEGSPRPLRWSYSRAPARNDTKSAMSCG